MILRNAEDFEMEEIYLMGFDTWSDGSSRNDYIATCLQSSKYKEGTWKVLSDGDNLLSSLIVYRLKENIFGIGSIATPERFRKKGFASILIEKVIDEMKPYSEALFLYADIDPKFYEKFGFIELDIKYQKYKKIKCMKLELHQGAVSKSIFIPDYF